MIVFDHYPKAGGSTIRNYLYQCFGPDAVFNIGPEGGSPTPQDFMVLTASERSRIRCVMAHHADRVRKGVAPDACWVTVVREPVSRAISWYHYARCVPGMPGHAAACEMDLVEFAQCHVLHKHLRMYYGHSVDRMNQRYELIGSQHDLTSFCVQLQQMFALTIPYTHRRINAGHYGPTDHKEFQKLCDLCSRDLEFYQAILRSPKFTPLFRRDRQQTPAI